jgi:hypothetical protein
MAYRGALAALLLGLALTAGTAGAHHSGAMFDRSKKMSIKGTIKEFTWANPHTWVTIVVPVEGAASEEWGIEGGSPNILARADPRWTGKALKPGDVVTLTISPVRDGRKMGVLEQITYADGSALKSSGL